MRLNCSSLLKSPVSLMITAVALWMLYPPIVNHIIDQVSILYVAAMTHSFAALCTLAFVAFLFVGNEKLHFKSLLSSHNLKKVALPTLLAGSLSCSTHLLLYSALNSSEEFDVITILIYETWPILFFLIDTALRRGSNKISISDYIFTGAAFSGFIVLTAPNLDIADWILFDSPMLKTVGIAALGGATMALTCFFRMKSIDVWNEISKSQNLNLSNFKQGVLTEGGARTVSAILLVIIFFLSEETIPSPELPNILLMAFVGVAILALGSLFYDLSVFNSNNAAISALWYLMPVGAVMILALMQGRLLNQYEAVASVLIVTSNIFLVLKYPLRSSLLILFVAVCSIGTWILFVPVSEGTHYYDLLAVSTIFFVLLATFALERITALNSEKESLLGEFNEQAIGILEHLSEADKREDSLHYVRKIKHYIFYNLHNFIRAFKDFEQLSATQSKVEKLKHSILPFVKDKQETREHLLSLFRIGDKLQTMESDRLPPEEFVILILLGSANIFFSLIFRPETLSSSLFALIVSTSIIYLLLIIFERDKYSNIKKDHALLCSNLLDYVSKRVENINSCNEIINVENEIKTVLSERSTTRETRSRSYWIFGVFVFLIVGFGYAFLYASLNNDRSIETSPLKSTYTTKKASINIALLDWPSAQIKGYILAGIIDQHTGLNASTISLSNDQVFEEMGRDKGLVDIHPDLWVENSRSLIRRYVTAFNAVTLSKKSVLGSQGLCYTEYDKKTLSMSDLATSKTANKYDLSGNGKGDIWVGANSWESTKIEQRRLSSYGLDTYYNYHIFDSETFKMLFERNKQNKLPSLFFCYQPDGIFNNDNVHFVNALEHNEKQWKQIINYKNKLPKTGTSWPQTKITMAYRSSLLNEHHELKTLLDNFSISNEDLITMLASIEEGNSAQDEAKKWIEKNNQKILEWLTGFKLSVLKD